MSNTQTSTKTTLVVILLAGLVALLPGCGFGSASERAAPLGAPKEVWLLQLLHSASDEGEEAAHIEALAGQLLPLAMERGATVKAYLAGAEGQTSPRLIASTNFDTTASDGGNPLLRNKLRAASREQLLRDITAGTRAPFSPATDVFGGIVTAKALFDQYPHDIPRRLVVVGDDVANRPAGCELSAANLSTPDHRARLLTLCSPVIPDLSGVEVALVGAGYSVDDHIDPATARNLELLLREYFALTRARLTLYAPLLVAGK